MSKIKEEKLNAVQNQIEESIFLKNKIKEELSERIVEISEVLAECLKKGGKILLCGNGGSAADAQHFAAELVVRLISEHTRDALPAIALTVNPSILTATANDFGFDQIFARQVEALGKKEDVLVAISTSGDSPNLIKAIEKAKQRHIKTIGLLGKDGGKMAKLVDFPLVVPSQQVQRIQEVHITICHILTSLIEKALFD
jgi:D-sedoheptulose 7-phosphate isomerase